MIVTSHAAFGQLASRYGLTSSPSRGARPSPSPGRASSRSSIPAFAQAGATTVFAEPLVPHGVVDTIAREAGRRGRRPSTRSKASREKRLAAGEDYPSVMRDDLAALRKALGCR